MRIRKRMISNRQRDRKRRRERRERKERRKRRRKWEKRRMMRRRREKEKERKRWWREKNLIVFEPTNQGLLVRFGVVVEDMVSVIGKHLNWKY